MGHTSRSKRKQNRTKTNSANVQTSETESVLPRKEILDSSGDSGNPKTGQVQVNEKTQAFEIEDFGEKLEKIKNILIESITIDDGKNQINIELSKKHNRVFKIDVYFNRCEIRPATYTGRSSAMNYWKLLKGLKKC